MALTEVEKVLWGWWVHCSACSGYSPFGAWKPTFSKPDMPVADGQMCPRCKENFR